MNDISTLSNNLSKKLPVKEEKEELVCKSVAKNTYFLTDKDIEHLNFEYRCNRVFRSSPFVLYKKDEIIKVFCDKYNISPKEIDVTIEHLLELKAEKRERRVANKERKSANRKELLTIELNNKGLELREDSVLCQSYIDGTLENGWTIPGIVKRMCKMKYLFEYCDMDAAIEEAKEYMRGEIEYKGYCSESLIDIAEEIILKTKKYPRVWPWLASHSTGKNNQIMENVSGVNASTSTC